MTPIYLLFAGLFHYIIFSAFLLFRNQNILALSKRKLSYQLSFPLSFQLLSNVIIYQKFLWIEISQWKWTKTNVFISTDNFMELFQNQLEWHQTALHDANCILLKFVKLTRNVSLEILLGPILTVFCKLICLKMFIWTQNEENFLNQVYHA